ncbi:3366_t:CDS:1 [Ambispora gerdemannii]|uniref:3366_t:CDS:1 n=1 Tax=Ambispora gerdemannii TaxID=144530 RepID=A0A9N9B8K2_9GLOM|nr:3366_t:CDS:1 [Ambispora gerdemannii]
MALSKEPQQTNRFSKYTWTIPDIIRPRIQSDIFYVDGGSDSKQFTMWRILVKKYPYFEDYAINEIKIALEPIRTLEEINSNIFSRGLSYEIRAFDEDTGVMLGNIRKQEQWFDLATDPHYETIITETRVPSIKLKLIIYHKNDQNNLERIQADPEIYVASHFNNQKFADIEFVFEHGNKIYAHKLILAANSHYFDKMFNGEWEESKAKQIPVNHVSFETFYALVQFLYTKNLPETISSQTLLFELYSEAHIHAIPALLKAVSKRLRESVNKENWDSLFMLARKYDDYELKAATLRCCIMNWSEAVDELKLKNILEDEGIDGLDELFRTKNLGVGI